MDNRYTLVQRGGHAGWLVAPKESRPDREVITLIAISSRTPSSSPAMALSATVQDLRQFLDEWRFEPNVTPLSQWHWPVSACVAYFTIIYIIQRVMMTRKAIEMPYMLFVHNMMLCIGSLIMAVWITYTLGSFLVRDGMTPYQVLCAKQSYDNGHIQLIYYINSIFKVWEFLDTFLLALRKKPIAFLHAYHHAATLILTWNQLMEHSAPQWVPIILNLWVHIIMYYYYAMTALRIRIWWKKYLTSFQIIQFVIDVVVIGYAYFTFIKSGYDKNTCYGTSRGAIVGLSILFSYLLLFVRFYFVTYAAPKKKKKKDDKASGDSDHREEKAKDE